MKMFKDCLEELNQLAKDRPELLDLQVIAAADDEGNGYSPVYFSPSFGYYDEADRDFYSENSDEDEIESPGPTNAVCLN